MSLNHIDLQYPSPIRRNKYYVRENNSLSDLKSHFLSVTNLKKASKDNTSISSTNNLSQTKLFLTPSPSVNNLRSFSQNITKTHANFSAKQTEMTQEKMPVVKKFQFASEQEIDEEKAVTQPQIITYAEKVRKLPKTKVNKNIIDFDRYMMTPMSGTPKCYGDFESRSIMKSTLKSIKLPSIFSHNQKMDATVDNINDELQKYKNLIRIVEVDGFYDKSHDLKVQMLSKTMHSPRTLPRNLGINKSLINDKRKINISSQFIGDRYGEIASEAFKHEDLDKVESIKLNDNNLTSAALSKIVNNLPKNIQKLNLSENVKIGKEGILSLAPALNEKKHNYLRVVNLENTNLQDEGAQIVIQSLLNSTVIQVLNISRNSITDAITPLLSKFLEFSDSLSELYIHWNKLTSKSGCLIADALKVNQHLMVLDLSFNCLGSHFALSSKMCGKKLFQSLNRPKCNLRHLDLSYNGFTAEEGYAIQEVIKTNDGIYGFHFEGNCNDIFYVDSRGFLIERNIEEDLTDQLHLKRKRIQGLKFIGNNRMQNDRMCIVDNCWICDGWQELQFIVEGLSDCTFLHLDFEGYRPIFMDKLPDGKFSLTKMCPPKKKIRFFFTDPTQYVAFSTEHYSKEKQMDIHKNSLAFKLKQQQDEISQPTIPSSQTQIITKDIEKTNSTQNIKHNSQRKIPSLTNFGNNDLSLRNSSKSRMQQKNAAPQSKDNKQKENTDKRVQFTETMKQLVYDEETGKYSITYQDGTVVDYEMPEYFNYQKTDINQQVFSKYKDLQILSYPRVPEKIIQLSQKKEWVLEKSVFKDYIKDAEDLIDKCFEFDYNQSRITKLVQDKDDQTKLKQILRENYHKIKRNYKLYSSYASGEIFCIAQNILSQFAIKYGIVDNKFSFADLDYNMIATSSVQKIANFLNPDKVLIRFKFMEILVRIAGDKYIKSGKCKKYSEAILELFNDPTFKDQLDLAEDPQEWRNTKFWNEGCDIILKQNMDFVKALWNQFADSRKTEKRNFMNFKTMNMSEFRDFITYYGFIDQSFNERDINMVFNMSMQTCIDEITLDKHLLMNFNEFLEALARVAEIKIFKEEENEIQQQSESDKEDEQEEKEDKDEVDNEDEQDDQMYEIENSSRYNSKRNSFDENKIQQSSLAQIEADYSEDENEVLPTKGKSVMFVKQKTIDIDKLKKSMVQLKQQEGSSSRQNTPSKNRSNKYESQNSLRGSQLSENNLDEKEDTQTITMNKNKMKVEVNSKTGHLDADFMRRQERKATKQVPLKIKLFQLINYILKKQFERAKKGDKKVQTYQKQKSLIDIKNSVITVEKNKEGTGYIRKIEASKLFSRATDKLQIEDQSNKK